MSMKAAPGLCSPKNSHDHAALKANWMPNSIIGTTAFLRFGSGVKSLASVVAAKTRCGSWISTERAIRRKYRRLNRIAAPPPRPYTRGCKCLSKTATTRIVLGPPLSVGGTRLLQLKAGSRIRNCFPPYDLRLEATRRKGLGEPSGFSCWLLSRRVPVIYNLNECSTRGTDCSTSDGVMETRMVNVQFRHENARHSRLAIVTERFMARQTL